MLVLSRLGAHRAGVPPLLCMDKAPREEWLAIAIRSRDRGEYAPGATLGGSPRTDGADRPQTDGTDASVIRVMYVSAVTARSSESDALNE